MPAADAGVAVTKLVTVHAGNAARGLPTIQGEVIVMRAETGERLGVLDGAAVTARRTAALSLLAANSLAPARTARSGSWAQARRRARTWRRASSVTSRRLSGSSLVVNATTSAEPVFCPRRSPRTPS